ncbi:hypothetical protein [Cytophaga hutchinsonii]|uniref:KTSC domain-containing protein n=1 Tax=Cytophaga hutchinsonii (strain ATCC 33406 / DSM 1761 / CIP 103989 / NBRC 15051 / NCIMB 9469 / D465) TaxID=269798 RepID=A0A6N4SPY4_CYTH3|nr:hypothetical protein [Cytophaga hutchinsonii]ABG58409.1 conserved hypothetical protein [Cytophaga hutchinsonii ATCC 33406]
MERYMNSTGKSEITHYETGDVFIRIQYRKSIVEYNASMVSQKHVEAMKLLAAKGSGLSRYIDKNIVHAKPKQKSAPQTQGLRRLLGLLPFFR